MARSKFTVEEVVKLFQLLDGIVIEVSTISNGYVYFSSEVHPFWVKSWFRLIFCVELETPKTAGVYYGLSNKKNEGVSLWHYQVIQKF